jgi:replicative DNA helicase
LKQTQDIARKAVFEKGLPASLEHEQGLLGTCMAGRVEDLELAASLVDADDFSIEKHRRIWAAIIGLHRNGAAVERPTVAMELRKANHLESVDGLAYLASLEPMLAFAGNCETYCRVLRGYATRRKAIIAAEKIQQLAFLESGSDELIGELQRATEALSASQIKNGSMLRADEVLERDFAGDPKRFLGFGEAVAACPIPWKEHLEGLRVGEMTILAARPGVGKSSAAAQIAMHSASAGSGVDFWSLEMRSGMILRRAVSGRAEVSHYQMQRGFLPTDQQRLACSALSQIFEMPLWFADDAGATVEQIRRRCREAKAHGLPLRLVVVDYLQLLAGAGSSRSNRNEEIGQISRGLKRLTLDFGVAVLALSQLSRDSEKDNNREPRLSDLRDSGSLEQDADNVVFIHKPTADAPGPTQEVRWLVRKQRNGQTGSTPLLFFRDQMRFVPMVTD